jgi:hypothetical protein
MRSFILLAASSLFLFSCKKDATGTTTTPPPVAEAIYFPPIGSTEWQITTPESLGWNTANIQPLYDYLRQQDTRAFLVLKNGKIVLEKYFGQNFQGTAFDKTSFWYWASAGKTLTGFMVGNR